MLIKKATTLLAKWIGTSQTKKQVVLFLFVGGINTVFSYCCYAFFLYLGFHYTSAITFSTCLGVLFAFNTTGRFVFNSSNYLLIFKFISLYVFLYGLNLLMLKGLALISHNYYLNGFITIFPCATLSFIINKIWVFQPRSGVA